MGGDDLGDRLHRVRHGKLGGDPGQPGQALPQTASRPLALTGDPRVVQNAEQANDGPFPPERRAADVCAVPRPVVTRHLEPPFPRLPGEDPVHHRGQRLLLALVLEEPSHQIRADERAVSPRRPAGGRVREDDLTRSIDQQGRGVEGIEEHRVGRPTVGSGDHHMRHHHRDCGI